MVGRWKGVDVLGAKPRDLCFIERWCAAHVVWNKSHTTFLGVMDCRHELVVGLLIKLISDGIELLYGFICRSVVNRQIACGKHLALLFALYLQHQQ